MVRNNADIVIATLPIAPSSSPHRRERLAPSIWAEVPIASPFADLLFIPNSFNKIGPMIKEIRADIITNKTVADVIPPRSLDIVNAIGRVADLGIKDANNCSCKWKMRDISNTAITPKTVPLITPMQIFL